ncbi:MAG: low specificity L-threonine aldolase [bacterium]
MTVWNFRNDYSEGCHPYLLDALIRANEGQQESYGDDDYTCEARDLIRKAIGKPDADVYFVSGGTQANLIVIGSALRPHESVISASTGHIHVHEAGAVETTGHKINTIENPDGKVMIEDIQAVLDEHTTIPHMVKPKLVYISNSTEIGTIYTHEELRNLSAFCKRLGLYLFCDGARLGSALCAKGNDLTLKDLAELTDIFYIGGTKNGAMAAEAIVIIDENLKQDYGYFVKQKGGLLAKGRFLGIQFLELFKDGLFFDLARHANAMAMKLAAAIEKQGCSFLTQSTTNQIFPILPNAVIDKLNENYGFYVWKKINAEVSAIRLVTSWATPEMMVDRFITDFSREIGLIGDQNKDNVR